MLIPAGLADRLKPEQGRVAVAAGEDGLYRELKGLVDDYNSRPKARPRCLLERVSGSPAEAQAAVEARLTSGEVSALVVLERELVQGEGEAWLVVHPAGMAGAPRELGRWIGDAVRKRRLALSGARPEAVARIDAPLKIETKVLGSRGRGGVEQAILARILAPIAAAMLLFLGIFSVSQLCLTNLIEERSGRVLEVLLAAVSPLELMAGKILGNGLLGLAVCAFWGVLGLAAAKSAGLGGHVTAAQAVLLPIYFVLGFLLFAAFYCAAGSICETVQGAQAMMLPLTLTAAVPLMLGGTISQNPSMPLARVLSLFPPMTPFAMMFRLALPPGPGAVDIALSIICLGAGVVAATWAASRIFRIGILMHGKTPGPAELWRWLWR